MNPYSKEWYLAVCGLDCSTCSIHTREGHILKYFEEKGIDPQKIKCDGCRSERNENHWSKDCELLLCCIDKKNKEFCGECDDFPCDKIIEWAKGDEGYQEAMAKMQKMKQIDKAEWLGALRS